ncbi:hypothetical protein JOQ06_026923 [Pogonophryne albipinna]|uniref:PX domain-containing protein n=1 Tax=Pogonophryne albipinna TaxID=1090488 RepID=A0AAD6BD03_9TELE|nr:hypothetical protein JOQ06_026923 [Pogonophryne albipinna]
MINNQEEDEFVAVRVQDPRVQNEGSWNSFVDYKIFLHTNSKAFTAKTSCVRRRYSEFSWLKKKLQKNTGLVPVPDLPAKSFFSFINEDFLERRRKGLQAFLDSVVNMTVCLSDSQLHLFLQTQLPVGHIQDCVQGHTPYSVTDAILTYVSSNRGYAQAQEDDPIKESSLTVSYESMESPVPHQPCLQLKETCSRELLSCVDTEPQDCELERDDKDTVEFLYKENSSVMVLQGDNHLEAIVEDCVPSEATFYLGESQNVPESLSLEEQTQQKSCQIQTPVEVHSPMNTDFQEKCVVDSLFEECSVREESDKTVDTEDMNVPHPDTEEKVVPHPDTEEKVVPHPDTEEKVVPHPDTEEKVEHCESSVEANTEKVHFDFKDSDLKDPLLVSATISQEEVLEVCSEKSVLENHVISEFNGLEHVDTTEAPVEDASCLEEFKSADKEMSDEPETAFMSEIHEETGNVHPEVEGSDDDLFQHMDQVELEDDLVEQEVDLVRTKDDNDEDSQSSSNESIVKVSDEESICDEAEELIHSADGHMETPHEEVAHWAEEVQTPRTNILDLHVNGCIVEKDDILAHEEDDLQYITEISDLHRSLDLISSVTGGDLTENSDFSILERSCTPELADSGSAEKENVSLLSLDASKEAHEVEVL